MEGAVHPNVSVAGKQRRRSIVRAGRRFPVKDTQTKLVMPPPVTISKKPRNLVLFRVFAIGTAFFVLLSTIALWRNRESRMTAIKEKPDSFAKLPSSIRAPTSEESSDTTKADSLRNDIRKDDVNESKESIRNEIPNDSVKSTDSLRGEERDMKPIPKDLKLLSGPASSSTETEKQDPPSTESVHTSTTEKRQVDTDINEKPEANTDTKETIQSNTDTKEQFQGTQEPVNRIEWYTREDFKEGKRPICRISNPIVLSNGTILLPEWMRGNEKLLQNCALGLHDFYSSSSEIPGVLNVVDVDADFALTIHLERFQEPTHVPSVFLTEHVLKASYLFDTFTGVARPDEGAPENHCVASEADTNCGIPPEKNFLKPGLFVPRKIANSAETTWPRLFINMLGMAHGNGNEVLHLNASSILIKAHAEQSDNLIGTRFRSILSADGMFRHLPASALDHSSFFSSKNGIERGRRERNRDGKCYVTVGISASDNVVSGFDASSELKQKLDMLSKFATHSQVHVKEIQTASTTGFEERIKQMQDLDVFVSGSGDDMTSIGFLPLGSEVFELMPFGITPDTHHSLAQALKVGYHVVSGKPQDESFKQCIESEIFNLRKKGKLQFTDTPEWKEPLMKAWEKAVGNFAMSGATDFDILTSEEPVKNYFSKNCALKQKIEVSLDEAAREVMTVSKKMCALS